jgi:hypothetical protein
MLAQPPLVYEKHSTTATSLKVQAAVLSRQASSFPDDNTVRTNGCKFVTIATKRNESLSRILKLQGKQMYTITQWNVRLSECGAYIRATFTKTIEFLFGISKCG